MNSLVRKLAILTGIGMVGSYLGHGAFAAQGKDGFLKLLQGSFKNTFGVVVDPATADSVVRSIGWLDIGVSALYALAVIGLIFGSGALYRFAVSRVMVGLYSVGIVWGFLTAASRPASTSWVDWNIWDLVERAPNFVLPLIGVYLLLELRRAMRARSSERPVSAHRRAA